MNKKMEFTDEEIQKLKSLVEVLKTQNGINTFEEVFGVLIRLKHNSELTESDKRILIDVAGGFVARSQFELENSKGIIEILENKLLELARP